MPKNGEENKDLAMHPLTVNIDKSDLFVPIKNSRQARTRKSNKVHSVDLPDGLKEVVQENERHLK